MIGLLLFTFAPNFLSLSNYFKYDIALLFWILFTFYSLLIFVKTNSDKWFVLSNIIAGLAVSTKISALPLLPILWVTFFIYQPNKWRSLSIWANGTAWFVVIALFFGFPDLLLGKGNYSIVLTDVIQHTPSTSSQYQLSMPYWWYLLSNQVFVNFGRALVTAFILAVIFLIVTFFKKKFRYTNRYLITTLVSFFWFLLSLLPLRLFATGNRALVLLPFMVLIVVAVLQPMLNFKNTFVKAAVLGFIFFQVLEGISWVAVKWFPDPRVTSSTWVEQNVPSGTVIGLLPSPIYEMPPDVLLLDYFRAQFDSTYSSKYQYQLITATDQVLPPVIIISGTHLDTIKLDSPKYQLLERLKSEGFSEVATFYPDRRFQQYFGSDIDFLAPNFVPVPRYIKIFSR